MGILDWLTGRRRADDERCRFFAEVEGPEDYERFVESIGRLAGLSLTARCRSDGRAVSLAIEGDGAHTHAQEGWYADVEALLPVLNGWLPEDEGRRLVDFSRGGEDFGVAFVDARGAARLRERGFRLYTRDAPRDDRLAFDGWSLSGEISFYDDGSPRRGTLTADSTIDGVPCAGGATIELDVSRSSERGTLLSATLSRALAVGDLSLPPGTRVHLYEEIATVAVAVLSERLEVAGVVLPAGTELELGEDGALYMATLGADTEVRALGRSLAKGTLITLDDGAWDLDDPLEPPAPSPSPYARRALERHETIDGYDLPAGTEVTTCDGELVRARLASPARLDGVPCAADTVTFSGGRLASAVLAEDHAVEGLRCRAGTELLLWSDGALSEGTLATGATVGGVALPAGARVGFYEAIGNPAMFALPVSAMVRGRACIAGQVVELDENGNVVGYGHVTDARYGRTYELVGGPTPYVA